LILLQGATFTSVPKSPQSKFKFYCHLPLVSFWKARNDDLFARKKTNPKQIAMHAKALMDDIEVLPLIPITICAPPPDHHKVPKSRDTVSIYFNVTGPKLYVDYRLED
jgi:hypothetical protein